MLLVEHTRCAEHGALVHGGGTHDHVYGGGAKSDREALESTPGEPSNEAHEDCALCADRRDALVSILDARILARTDGRFESFVSPDEPVVLEAHRFRLAPKNSPPA
jgi:hypothetical protein